MAQKKTNDVDYSMQEKIMALYELQANVHDVESNVLTIKRSAPSAWANKANTLRQMPKRK